jgi:predicted aminopeptidase
VAAKAKKGRRTRAAVLAGACVLLIVAVSGCQTIRFYSQAAAGQYEILAHQKLAARLIEDPGTDPKLKAQLKLVEKIRTFAAKELKLQPNGSYLKYVDVHRPFVVWNVIVAPRLSLAPKTWWFPIVGRASYRGYFSEAAARDYAAIWDAKGWDTYIGDVTTYSTLGWFRDPLMSTFIFESEDELADTIFHELTHKRLFIAGDTDFNEAFATAVAAEGVRRWYQAAANAAAYERYAKNAEREHDFVRLVMATRDELQKVYEEASLPDAAKLRRKEEIGAGMRAKYEDVKKKWGVTKSGYDGWFARPLNNAELNTVAAYYELVPAFHALLRADGGDLEVFYGEVAKLGKLPLDERHAALQSYVK